MVYAETSLPNLIDPEGRFGKIIVPVIEDLGFRLIRVAFGAADPKRGATLQILIEPSDGSKLGVEDCRKVSKILSAVMDVEDPINDSYVLEVGSAGLDRPLTDKRDFDRFKGYEAKIECKRPDENGQKRFRGFIESINDNGVMVKTQDRGEIELQWQDLSQARLVASDILLKALQNNEV